MLIDKSVKKIAQLTVCSTFLTVWSCQAYGESYVDGQIAYIASNSSGFYEVKLNTNIPHSSCEISDRVVFKNDQFSEAQLQLLLTAKLLKQRISVRSDGCEVVAGLGSVAKSSRFKATSSVDELIQGLKVYWQPAMINAGEPTELFISAPNAEYCLGHAGKNIGNDFRTGLMYPTEGRTVNIRCFSASGQEVVKHATLTVTNKPTIQVEWQPATVTQGESANLVVSSQNTSYCLGNAGKRWGTNFSTGFMPIHESKPITVKCFNDKDEVAAKTVTIKMLPRPSISVKWSPATITKGEQSELIVSSSNAEYCLGHDGRNIGTQYRTGLIDPGKHANNDLNIRCYSKTGVEVLQQAHLNVLPKPTVSVRWSPATITDGEQSELIVSSSNAKYCLGHAGRNIGTEYRTGLIHPGNHANNYLKIRCYSKTGSEVSQQVRLNVLPRPSVSVRWSPATITDGEQSELIVSSSNAEYCLGHAGRNIGTDYRTGLIHPGNHANNYLRIRCYSKTGTEVSQQVRLNVLPRPTVNVWWSPTRINAGGQSSLIISSSNAAYCLGNAGKNIGTSFNTGPLTMHQNKPITITCVSPTGYRVQGFTTLYVD